MAELHSTGRGGVGNIGAPDKDTVYVDGGIIREGDANSAIGSSGRGGAGNIGHEPKPKPTTTTSSGDATGAAGSTAPAPPKSKIVVPQTATLPEVDDFHCGRGGGGNIHRKKYGGHSQPMTPKDENGGQMPIMAKLKQLVGLDGKPQTPEAATTTEPSAEKPL